MPELSVKEAASHLGLTVAWVRRLYHHGRLQGRIEETPRGPVIWLDAASVRAYVPEPMGWKKGRKRTAA